MPISKFKATCLAALERVRRTRRPLLVTRFGVPVAQILPPPPGSPAETWLGALAGTVRFSGDIVAPASEPDDWDALKS
jgi:hypothetical protein